MIPNDYLKGKKFHKYIPDLHQGRYRPHINKDDKCYYMIEIVSEGYSVSEANNLMHNFKKPLHKKENPKEWQFKIKAIQAIGRMLCMIKFNKPYTIIS